VHLIRSKVTGKRLLGQAFFLSNQRNIKTSFNFGLRQKVGQMVIASGDSNSMPKRASKTGKVCPAPSCLIILSVLNVRRVLS